MVLAMLEGGGGSFEVVLMCALATLKGWEVGGGGGWQHVSTPFKRGGGEGHKQVYPVLDLRFSVSRLHN